LIGDLQSVIEISRAHDSQQRSENLILAEPRFGSHIAKIVGARK